MGHCACIALMFDDENVLDANCGNGFDYYTTFDDDKDTVNWYRGLTLKDGIENEYMYVARDGNKYAYKAKMQDIDLAKTLKNSDMYCFCDYRMLINKYDFNTEEEFHSFFVSRFNNATDVEIVDIHI
jgi:hypothetical protein